MGLIVFSKDQDEGIGHVNIVSLRSLILCFRVLLILTAGLFYAFITFRGNCLLVYTAKYPQILAPRTPVDIYYEELKDMVFFPPHTLLFLIQKVKGTNYVENDLKFTSTVREVGMIFTLVKPN